MGNHEVASPALPIPGANIMKLTPAENIDLAEGKSDVILFCERLIECGLFKLGARSCRRASACGCVARAGVASSATGFFSTGSTAAPDA